MFNCYATFKVHSLYKITLTLENHRNTLKICIILSKYSSAYYATRSESREQVISGVEVVSRR